MRVKSPLGSCITTSRVAEKSGCNFTSSDDSIERIVSSLGTSVTTVTLPVAKEIVKSLGRLVTGSGRDEVSSPIGITRASSDAVQQGADSYLWVLGLISLSLALLNLLPLLPLDGGHILFTLIEGARGRFLRREIYERVSMVGLALVLLLFFVGLSNDIGKLS